MLSSKFPWRRDLFTGRPDAAMRYTVIGIGGLSGKLVREIAVSRTTSVELEVARHDQSRANRMPRYDVGHGAAWSHSFISASRRRLGWSLEPRSLRHAYVLNRMEALQSGGYRYDEALEVIAQEVGLLRARTIERYLPRPPKAKK